MGWAPSYIFSDVAGVGSNTIGSDISAVTSLQPIIISRINTTNENE